MSRKIFIVSISLNALLLSLAFLAAVKYREQLCQKWIEYRGKADLVMFGDSHTASGKWNSLIEDRNVLCMGWGGFTSDQLRPLIARSIRYRPQYVFILAGANDPLNDCYAREQTMANFRCFADTLRSANIIPVFQKLLYRSGDPSYNAEMDTLNALLQAYCAEQKFAFIDITRDLNGPGGLLPSLTKDGVHLNRDGYLRWSKVVNEFLEMKSGR